VARINWTAIKEEYITTDATLRELSDKHGVSLRQLGRRSKAEDWVEARREHVHRMSTRLLNNEEQRRLLDILELLCQADGESFRQRRQT